MSLDNIEAVYKSQLAKTIALILDELDRTKESLLILNPDNFNAHEAVAVDTAYQSVLMQVRMLANAAEGLVAASKTERDNIED